MGGGKVPYSDICIYQKFKLSIVSLYYEGPAKARVHYGIRSRICVWVCSGHVFSEIQNLKL